MCAPARPGSRGPASRSNRVRDSSRTSRWAWSSASGILPVVAQGERDRRRRADQPPLRLAVEEREGVVRSDSCRITPSSASASLQRPNVEMAVQPGTASGTLYAVLA